MPVVDQTDRAELRRLVDAERQALAEMQASVGKDGADVTKLDAWIKASGKMATAARVHFPALLDELDAADLASLPCKSGEGAGATAKERWDFYRSAASVSIPDATQTREAEAWQDAWNEFFNEHLTDGNDGYRSADVISQCRAAFDAAWVGGEKPANEAARAALNARGGA